MKVNSFAVKKTKSRRYSAKTILDADYGYDIVLLANTPIRAESLLHSLEQAAGSIGLSVNADKMEYNAFQSKRRHDTKWWFSEIRGQFYLPRKQRLIF